MTAELNEIVFKFRGRTVDFIPKYPDLDGGDDYAWCCEINHRSGPLRGYLLFGSGRTARIALYNAIRLEYSPTFDSVAARNTE